MSAASEKFEKDVAKNVNNIPGMLAEQGTDVKYSDVLMTKGTKKTWLEVKMSHSDNLSNPRVFYKDRKWQTTYTTPAAAEAIKLLNSSRQATEFIKKISAFSGIPESSIIIATNKGQLKLPGTVPLHIMKMYFEQPGINRYIASQENFNIGDLVTRHYLEGKAAPAHYMQAGDDFYKIGKADPFGVGMRVPLLSGRGDFKVRVSTRSQFYEVQAEIKIKSMPNSLYSVKPGTRKKNPFLID